LPRAWPAARSFCFLFIDDELKIRNLKMAGYSGTPLVKKLGIKEGDKIFTKNAPAHYWELLAPLPLGVEVSARLSNELDFVHLFTYEKNEMEKFLPTSMKKIKPNGMIWISWPKKVSKLPTDITEDVIREVALPLGLVDIKVCAVDEIWSGLKLVIRKENRRA
jgi:hypothetical protein